MVASDYNKLIMISTNNNHNNNSSNSSSSRNSSSSSNSSNSSSSSSNKNRNRNRVLEILARFRCLMRWMMTRKIEIYSIVQLFRVSSERNRKVERTMI